MHTYLYVSIVLPYIPLFICLYCIFISWSCILLYIFLHASFIDCPGIYGIVLIFMNLDMNRIVVPYYFINLSFGFQLYHVVA